jgi:hypothetical protein
LHDGSRGGGGSAGEDESVARLTAAEFREMVEELVQLEGLAKLQEKLHRSHALVSRRRLGSIDALASQLHRLTLGLERDGLVTQVVVALWEELLRQKLDEEAGRQLEELAERINGCLLPTHEVDPAKEEDVCKALSAYRDALAVRVGDIAARLTMLTRAFPSIARLIRELPANA